MIRTYVCHCDKGPSASTLAPSGRGRRRAFWDISRQCSRPEEGALVPLKHWGKSWHDWEHKKG